MSNGSYKDKHVSIKLFISLLTISSLCALMSRQRLRERLNLVLTRIAGRPWNNEDRVGAGGASSMGSSPDEFPPDSLFETRPGAILLFAKYGGLYAEIN